MIPNAIRRLTLNPYTGKWQRAQWCPNWRQRPGRWVVRFPSMKGEVDPQIIKLQSRNG